MVNTSVSSIVFEWERYSDGYIIQVEPPIGELGRVFLCLHDSLWYLKTILEAPKFLDFPYFYFVEAQSEYDFEVTVSSPVPQKIAHNLLCYVHHLDEPLTLHVEVHVKVSILHGTKILIEITAL